VQVISTVKNSKTRWKTHYAIQNDQFPYPYLYQVFMEFLVDLP
jgi:hypothetical protein